MRPVRRRAAPPHARPLAGAAARRSKRRRCASGRSRASGDARCTCIADHAKYVRAPVGGNVPLSMWSNRWSTMPIHAYPDLRLPLPDDRAVLDRMPGSTVPVIRQPFAAGDALPVLGVQRVRRHARVRPRRGPGRRPRPRRRPARPRPRRNAARRAGRGRSAVRSVRASRVFLKRAT